MTEEEKGIQRYFDDLDKERIMGMDPNRMNLSEFLVYKNVIHCTDLNRIFNLNGTRDGHIGTVRKITDAMNEWAEMRSKDAVFYYQAGQQ